MDTAAAPQRQEGAAGNAVTRVTFTLRLTQYFFHDLFTTTIFFSDSNCKNARAGLQIKAGRERKTFVQRERRV
ncbi:hypothetical protein BaRGS_00020659 [Batillaria attramentaria]|uniref:Uncharacterized protein n=1 Tax=Batillaria attramentaria TaxID=370345 RepID=A0ABD0KM36_9CAEN